MRDNNFRSTNGGSVGTGGVAQLSKLFHGVFPGAEIPINTSEQDMDAFDRDRFKQAIAQVESRGGKYMTSFDPNSTARGLYQQRYSDIKDMPELQGMTIDQFTNDTEMQNRIMDMALEKGISGANRGLIQSSEELMNEYAPQLGDQMDLSQEDIAALIHFMGRQGTRNYLGYHLRDKQPLEQAVPNMYGTGKIAENKTPEEYIRLFRESYNR